jgi:hypothetical protein
MNRSFLHGFLCSLARDHEKCSLLVRIHGNCLFIPLTTRARFVPSLCLAGRWLAVDFRCGSTLRLLGVMSQYSNMDVCSMLYEADGVRLAVCACYSWEMALNMGLDASFDKM